MDIGNYHKSKGDIFEMNSDKGGRLKTLHWSGSYSKLFDSNYSDFLLINTVVGSLGKFVQIGFLVAPSEHSYSITRQMNLLKLTRTGCCIP